MKVKDLLRSLEGVSGDLDVCVEDVDGKCINLTDVSTVKPVVYLGSVQEFPDDWYDDEGMEVGYDYRKEDEAVLSCGDYPMDLPLEKCVTLG